MRRHGLWLFGALIAFALAALAGERGSEEAPKAPPRAPRKGGLNKGGQAKGGPAKAGPTKGGPTKGGPRKGGPTKGGPPKGRPAEGEPTEGEPEEGEESEEGTVFVLQDSDAVVLRDGTRINGTILCAGQAAVTILTPQGEKSVPREQIERIIKNTDAGFPKKFRAEELDGHKYLKDEGGTPPAEGGKEAAGPVLLAPPGPPPKAPPAPVPAGEPEAEAPAQPPAAPPAAPPAPAPPLPPAPPKPIAPAPPKAPPAPAPAEKPGAAPPAQAPAVRPPAGPVTLPALTIPKDPAQLRAWIQQLRREGKYEALLKDPRVLDALTKALWQKAAE